MPAQAPSRRSAEDLLSAADQALESGDVEAFVAMLPKLFRDESITTCMHSMFHALAAGRGVHVLVDSEHHSPSEAAELLGVSRTLVRKLMDSGQLPYTTKPHSRHRLIAAADIRRIQDVRDAWATMAQVSARATEAAADRGIDQQTFLQRAGGVTATDEDREHVANLVARMEREQANLAAAEEFLTQTQSAVVEPQR